jgi:hypothetical protein
MSPWPETVEQTKTRAGDRCEYCRMHQALQGATFHIEHIVPSSQGGLSELENLALCPSCNLRKSNLQAALDPETGEVVSLFHPRRDVWQEHFRWEGFHLVATSSVGRATIQAFDLNHPRRV